MGFYENLRDGMVARNVAKYGMAMTLRVSSSDTFDPDTGAVTVGPVKNYAVQGLIYPDRRGERRDPELATKTAKLLLSASGMTVIPTVSDRILVGTQEYEITGVTPLRPAGVTVIYDLDVVMP